MAAVGVAEAEAFDRLPLTLVDARGAASGCAPARRSRPSRSAVLGRRGWSCASALRCSRRRALATRRLSLRAGATVAELWQRLPAAVRRELIEPLCVAALNTPGRSGKRHRLPARPARRARAQRPAASDLLLPRRRPERSVLSAPALAWLEHARATIRLAHRVERLERRRWLAGVSTASAPTASSSPPARSRLRGWRRRTSRPGQHVRLPFATSRSSPSMRAALGCTAARAAARCFRRRRPAGAVRLRPRPARRRDRPARLRHQRRRSLGRARRGRDRAGDARAGAGGARPLLRAPLVVVRTIVEKRATFAARRVLDRPPMTSRRGLLAGRRLRRRPLSRQRSKAQFAAVSPRPRAAFG